MRRSWQNCSDAYRAEKDRKTEYRENCDGFLVHDSKRYGDFGNFIVCDVRTHQIYTEYTSADLMGWLKGTNILFDTTISGSMSTDALYELNESKLIKTVDAWRMEDYYFVNNQQTSEEEYAEAFDVLLTGEAVMLTDLCGTYEEFIAKLQ